MDEEKTPYKNPLAGLDLRGVQALLKERLSVLAHGYKLPYMQWYEDDFKSSEGVEEMAPLSRLMYRQLLAKAWVSRDAPYLPADKERLFRLADCPNEELWEKHSGQVLAMFEKTKDKKRLFHSRQLLDYVTQIVKISANTINGRKGGRPPKSKKIKDIPETQMKPDPNPTETQSELELESKLESKSQAEIYDSSEQGEAMKTERQIDILTQQFFGKKAYLRGRNGGELKTLILLHKGSSVERAYIEWCQSNQGNPDIHDPVAVFLEAANECLGAETPLQAVLKDPEVVSLARELSYLASGQIAFLDKQRVRLAEVLKEFSAPEIISVFGVWLGEQDLSDPKNVPYLPGKFVQIVDGLAYAARKKSIESEKTRLTREETAKKLQKQAEDERAKKPVESDFDPLADVV
jgi:uncharacterized protein YdaU (DUF1376 family)